jgi:hypothetical protein
VARALELAGEKFGRLTVLHRDLTVVGKAMWYCECDCGRITRVQTYDLRRVDYPTKSCGCLRKYRSDRRKLENKKRALIEKRRGLIVSKKGPRTQKQKKLNKEALNREYKQHVHYESLISRPHKTVKIFRLYGNQQPIEVVMQNIKRIEEIQIPLGVHRYSTIVIRNPSGKPGLLEYNVIETRKQIMDISEIDGLV